MNYILIGCGLWNSSQFGYFSAVGRSVSIENKIDKWFFSCFSTLLCILQLLHNHSKNRLYYSC